MWEPGPKGPLIKGTLMRKYSTGGIVPALVVPVLVVPALVVLAIVGLTSRPVCADTGIPFVGEIEFVPEVEVAIRMLPDASGPPLSEARTVDTLVMDATIGVRLVDEYWQFIPNFPAEDLWLAFAVDPGTATACFNHPNIPGGIFIADAATDSYGWTSFALPLRGGGWSTGPVTVYLNGEPAFGPDLILHPPLPLRANSPDLNGDGAVNLADLSQFTQDLLGVYHFRSDLYWDAVINLSDVSLIAQGNGVVCE